MAEKPILFSAPMVRALLAGRKTQTRRIVKPQPINPMDEPSPDPVNLEFRWDHLNARKPKYWPGDTLWVREACCIYRYKVWTPNGLAVDEDRVLYKADGGILLNGHKWRPSIHMPRWASRITLRVTDVRAQRVQDISEEDAEAEGITGDDALIGQVANPFRTAFADLWDSVNGEGAWERNDWVWAYAVEVVK